MLYLFEPIFHPDILFMISGLILQLSEFSDSVSINAPNINRRFIRAHKEVRKSIFKLKLYAAVN